ncbi:diguanylate cyclase [Pseudomonas sp. Sample_16]|uniref:GGDEF domain-containing protein n=2 Tax=Pseudomonas TaxID=286 RepID=UPI0015B30769|nr:diguanylate cyclase [Pseudomonas sp. Sample_16]
MSQSESRANVLALYPEDSREAAALLKQAVPLMVRHNIPPNPVHYALWYTYSKGLDPELNRHLDRVVRDFDGCPPESATRLFREYIIRDELEDARAEQHQVISLVDGMERDISRSVQGSQNFQNRLGQCLEMLDEPVSDRLPGILNELQQSTRVMQSQQEHFLGQLQSAQNEIKTLRDKLERAQRAATVDGLTELLNRTAFTRLLQQALGKASRAVALVMLDIDHFKQFNDQYGHPLGDRVLQHVGQVLRGALPANAFAGRYGGEEFCVVLEGCADLAAAHAFAEHLRLKVQSLRIKARGTDTVLDTITASFGVAFAQPDDNLESLVTRADDGLYEAKRNGRNQVHALQKSPASSCGCVAPDFCLLTVHAARHAEGVAVTQDLGQ